jgi:REP-associated tyrosine transposase
MPKFDPQKHHRRSIRLQGYDYASVGAYYVTIVAWHRECLFGEVVNKEMMLNRYGEIVQKWWEEIPVHFPDVETGAFIVMPNHVHGIIFITERRGTVSVPREYGANEISNDNDTSPEIQGGGTPPLQISIFTGVPTLGQILAYFKYQSTREMNLLDNTGTVTKFWQRNYYEHILRNETDLQNKTDYIEANPLLWDEDDENPIHANK